MQTFVVETACFCSLLQRECSVSSVKFHLQNTPVVFTHSQLQTLSPVDISTDIDPESCTATQKNLVSEEICSHITDACVHTHMHAHMHTHVHTHSHSHSLTHTHCYLHMFKHSNQPCVSCRHPSGYCTYVCVLAPTVLFIYTQIPCQ